MYLENSSIIIIIKLDKNLKIIRFKSKSKRWINCILSTLKEYLVLKASELVLSNNAFRNGRIELLQ